MTPMIVTGIAMGATDTLEEGRTDIREKEKGVAGIPDEEEVIGDPQGEVEGEETHTTAPVMIMEGVTHMDTEADEGKGFKELHH